jgi:sulfofructose kinase
MSANIIWDVLGFGAVAIDDLLYVDTYPMPDTKVAVRDQKRQGGGLVGTALVAAARLGARAAYAGVLGDDDLSRYTISEFEREGVGCSLVLRHAEARPIHSIIIVDRSNGQRSILPSFVGVQWRQPEEMPEAMIAACRVLFVDHHGAEGGLQAARLAHAHAIPVVADIERDNEPFVNELAAQVDHLIVGIRYAQHATGESDPAAMVRALAAGRACAVVTAGELGCWYQQRGGEVGHVPALQVNVVDTNGCGDVFHGAYAGCIAKGEPVDLAVRVATVAASLKATRPGGRAGIPTRAQVDGVLKDIAWKV